MCLRTEQSRSLIADKNITCYKILNKKNDRLTSQFQEFKYELNKLYKLNYPLDPIFTNIYILKKGFHSYIYLKDAKNDISLYEFRTVVMVKCTIPKGSEYFIGIDGNGIPNYCANKIIIKEIINN